MFLGLHALPHANKGGQRHANGISFHGSVHLSTLMVSTKSGHAAISSPDGEHRMLVAKRAHGWLTESKYIGMQLGTAALYA